MAVAGKADAIVSVDADLLTLNEYSGIEILSPRQFVARQTPTGRRSRARSRVHVDAAVRVTVSFDGPEDVKA